MTDEVSSIFKLVMLALYIFQCRKQARRSMRDRLETRRGYRYLTRADAARSVESWWETEPCERRFVLRTLYILQRCEICASRLYTTTSLRRDLIYVTVGVELH